MKRNCNPDFNETLTFHNIPKDTKGQELSVQMWLKTTLSTKYSCGLRMRTSDLPTEEPAPTWHNLSTEPDQPAASMAQRAARKADGLGISVRTPGSCHLRAVTSTQPSHAEEE